MAAGPNEVKVNVIGVFEQPVGPAEQEQPQPLVVVRDEAGRRELHVPVGSCEGVAIQIALTQEVAPRPLTHDLAVRLLERLSAELERVVIDALGDHTYYARLHLKSVEGEVTIEARPGDAVALAVRAEAPIYVVEDVLVRDGRPGGEASA